MQFTIRAKLLVLFFALAVAPLALVGIVSYYNSIQAVEAVLEQRTKADVDKAVAQLETLFAQRQSEAALLARNRQIQDLYQNPEALDTHQPQIEAFFAQFFSDSRRAFARVTYFTAAGAPLFAYGRGAEDLKTGTYDFIEVLPDAIDLSNKPVGKIAVSNVQNDTHGPVVRLERWIKDLKSGTRVGYLQADLAVKALLEDHAKNFPKEDSEYLLIAERQHNRLVFFPKEYRLGQPVHLFLPALGPVLERLKQATDGWDRFNDGELDWLVSYANSATLDWSFVILSEPATFIAPVRKAGLFNLAITFAAVLLALILIPWTINRITRSIRQITQGAEAIAAGHLDQHINLDSRDETRTLAEAFNRMSASLKTTLGELQALTEELEDRVERRTAQLAQSNAQLEQINTQLEAANSEIKETTQRKSAFLASMSHDLRTPMNAIIGYTRILLRRAQDTLEPRLYKNLQNIESSSNNLLELINGILDLSRIESGRIEIKPTDVNLKQLAEECAASVVPLVKEGVELKQTLAEVPALHTDSELLRRVLINLLGNAVKFTETGSITLSMHAVENQIEITIADTGVGIPPEDLPYIFEEFRQVERDGAEAQGSGLGLAIVKKTVELLGGTIEAGSKEGSGTTFTLQIKNYSL